MYFIDFTDFPEKVQEYLEMIGSNFTIDIINEVKNHTNPCVVFYDSSCINTYGVFNRNSIPNKYCKVTIEFDPPVKNKNEFPIRLFNTDNENYISEYSERRSNLEFEANQRKAWGMD